MIIIPHPLITVYRLNDYIFRTKPTTRKIVFQCGLIDFAGFMYRIKKKLHFYNNIFLHDVLKDHIFKYKPIKITSSLVLSGFYWLIFSLQNKILWIKIVIFVAPFLICVNGSVVFLRIFAHRTFFFAKLKPCRCFGIFFDMLEKNFLN